MTTSSGVTKFHLDIHEIINSAYDMIGGGYDSAEDSKRARRALNLLFVDMINRSAPLAQLDFEEISLVGGQRVYELGEDVVDVVQVASRQDNLDTPMERLTRVQYLNLPNKEQSGQRPTQYTVEREIDKPELVVWPVPSNSDNKVVFYAIKYIEDVVNSYEAPDISKRYLPAIIFGLAYYLSYNRVDIPRQRMLDLRSEYTELLDNAMSEGGDRANIHITPYING